MFGMIFPGVRVLYTLESWILLKSESRTFSTGLGFLKVKLITMALGLPVDSMPCTDELGFT